MIEIQIRHLTSQPGQSEKWETLTTLRADGNRVDLQGDAGLIDFSIPVLSLRTGGAMHFEEDREEWVRALSHMFRSPDLTVAVVSDSHPISPHEIHAPDIERQPVELPEAVA